MCYWPLTFGTFHMLTRSIVQALHNLNNEVTNMLILALPEPLANPSSSSLIWDSHIWNQFNNVMMILNF